jgi:hypothetical protein
MANFKELSKELQGKVRMMEHYANDLGKEAEETQVLWKELKKDRTACFALNQKDGNFKACLRPTEEDSNRCRWHGGRSLKGDEMTPAQKLNYMKNLRSDAHLTHGLYAEKGNFVASLTKEEIEYMAWLDDTVRSQYEVERGLGDLVLEGLLHDAVIHFRLLNSGKLERGSKSTVKPLMDILKTVKEQGWSKRSQASGNSQSVLGDMILKLDRLTKDEDDKPQIKRIK